ncbi:MAG: pectinesterase family protein [Verrucomicrobiota bacterium]|jgi:pectinesterase
MNRVFALAMLLVSVMLVSCRSVVPGANQPKPDLIVAADGSGDFKTIQAAVASIPNTNTDRIVVFIKNGTYHEKIRVDASCVTLRGQSRKGTRIEFPQLDEDYTQNPDPIGRAVINLNHADDFVLENLTAENTAGVIGPHAFTLFGTGDRAVVVNCDVLSHGADTVSFWRGERGRCYQANCRMEGSVDFVCPRGWCYVTNCSFYEWKDTAAVWHDGSKDKDMKFVLRGCRFDGTNGWNLARHHHDAQFYFLDCRFSKTMIDLPPFRVIYPLDGGTPTASDIQRNKDLDKSNVWGERSYFYDCHRDGGDYAWFANNLSAAPGAPTPSQITAAWTFAGTWNPERTSGPTIQKISTQDGSMTLVFSENVTVKSRPRLKLSDGTFADYASGSGGNTLVFTRPQGKSAEIAAVDLNGGAIIASEADAMLRLAQLTLPGKIAGK